MRRRRDQLLTVAAGVVPLVVSGVAYGPVTRSYFFADDFFNFVRIADSGWLRYIFTPMAGHVVLVRALVNSLHYAAFGIDAAKYFWFVLANHLVNVGLTFIVLHRITRRRGLALLGAAVWGTSPVHADALSWYAGIGSVMSLTVMLLVLAILLSGGRDREPPKRSTAALCSLLLLGGATCYGTGLALAITLPGALLFLVPELRQRNAARTILLATPFLTVGLYFGLRHVATWLGEGTGTDEFVIKAALEHLDPILLMWLHLVRLGLVRLLAGAWVSESADPVRGSWILVAAVMALVVLAVIRGDTKTRAAVVAMLALCGVSYGIIALGRANFYLMMGTDPAKAANALRYHYVGSQPLVMLLIILLAWLRREGFGLVVRVAAVGLLTVQAWALATHPIHFLLYPEARAAVAERLGKAENEIRRAPVGETLFLQNDPLPATVIGTFGARYVPGTAALILIAHGGDHPLGHDVRFMEADPTIRADYQTPRSRWLAHLLVTGQVTLGGDTPDPTPPPCELHAMKVQFQWARALLTCERRALALGFDVRRCRAAASLTAARRPVAPAQNRSSTPRRSSSLSS